MPFKSEAQRRLMWAKHPKIARRWTETYGVQKDLPGRVGEATPEEKKSADSTEGAMTFEEKVIDAFQLAGAALEKADKAYQEKTAQDQAVSRLVPAAAEALLRNGRIEPTEKEAALKALHDPVKVLEILIKTAAHRNAGEEAALGQPVDRNHRPAQNGHTKKASAIPGSEDSPFVGARTSMSKPSDMALLRGLGLDNLGQ